MHYDTGLYSTGCKEKIAADEAEFWSTVSEMNLQGSRILLSKVSTPSLTFLVLFGILIMAILRVFKPPLVTFIFPTCKNIKETVFEANL